MWLCVVCRRWWQSRTKTKYQQWNGIHDSYMKDFSRPGKKIPATTTTKEYSDVDIDDGIGGQNSITMPVHDTPASSTSAPWKCLFDDRRFRHLLLGPFARHVVSSALSSSAYFLRCSIFFLFFFRCCSRCRVCYSVTICQSHTHPFAHISHYLKQKGSSEK